MFRYADTNKVSKPKEAQRKVVTEVREVTYINYHPDELVIEPVISTGYEILSEMVVSPEYPQITPIISGKKTVDSRFDNNGNMRPRVQKKLDKRKMFLNEPEKEEKYL